jgi:hypothetical protein
VTESVIFAHRQKTHLFGHELWVAERAEGSWQIWIEGPKPLGRPETADMVFPDEKAAKKAAHTLAHQHLRGKDDCNCPKPLAWQQPDATERRAVKRFDYVCKVQWGQGVGTGYITNLSVEGAFIKAPFAAPSEGSLLALQFEVGGRQINADGEVVHHRPNYGVGVRFLDLDPQGRRLISDLGNPKPLGDS